MTKTEIEIKLSYAKADVKKYEKLLQKDSIHCYDKRKDNKEQFMRYVKAKSSTQSFIEHHERLLDKYLDMNITKDRFDLYRTDQYAMYGQWEKKAKMIKEPFFTILKHCVDRNIMVEFHKKDGGYMIEEH